MSPLGEAYRRARGRKDGTGDQDDSRAGPPAARGDDAPGPASGAGGKPGGARGAGVPRPSVTQAFAAAAPPRSQDGGGRATQAIATTGAGDDVLSRASRVAGFAEGPLRAGCDELVGLKSALYAAGLDEPPATVVVASPMRGAGTTLVAVGLAGELARDLSHRVLLVDADVRSPGVAGALDVDAGFDLADVLDMRADLGEAILHSEVDNLSALVLRPNAATGASRLTSESLAGAAAREVFGILESAFGYLVVDAGATEESAAARVVAARATGVVLVLPVGVTRTRARSARGALESAGGRILGAVLTGGSPPHGRRPG